MKKKSMFTVNRDRNSLLSLLRFKKLTAMVIFLAFMQVSASVYSQTPLLSLKIKNSSLKEIFHEIERQSKFTFLYNDTKIDVDRKMSLDVKGKGVEEILDLVLANTRVEYKVVDNQIVLVLLPEQTKVITGIVTDEQGSTMPGVNVFEKSNSTHGTTTGIDGAYSIKVKNPKDILVFSFIGFETQEIIVGDRVKLDIKLYSQQLGLDEVVVTALGIRRDAKALGYAITEVKGSSIAQAKDNSFVSALSGMVAGVSISQGNTGPSGSSRVVIRGNAELGGNNQPLYVVDGIPIDNTPLGGAGKMGGYDEGDGLSGVNPEDIESVSVLKGPSSTALYGSRASNGVILITTKTGKGQKGIGIELKSSIDFINISKSYDSFQQLYGQGTNGQMPESAQVASVTSISSWGALLDPSKEIEIFDGSVRPYALVPDNIQSFFRIGSNQTNNLTITSGSDKSNFRFSVANTKVKDIVPNSGMDRLAFSMRGISKIGSRIEVDSKLSYTLEDVDNRPALGDLSNNVGLALFSLAPNLDQAWLKNYKGEDGNYREWNGDQYRVNPYWSINETSNTSKKNRVIGFLNLKYKIFENLSIQARAGTDYYQYNFSEFLRYGTPFMKDGRMIEKNTTVREDNYDFLIRYSKRFMDDQMFFMVNAGGSHRSNSWETIINRDENQVIREDGFRTITNYKENFLEYSNLKKKVNSIYGMAHLAFREYLFMDVTLRNDWSTTLPDENNSYLYPSVSSSFIFSDAFKLDNSFFTFGKLRLSYAEVGGDTDPYQLNLTYQLQPYTHLGKSLGSIGQNFMPNNTLKPTRTKGYEGGLDLRFFDNRLGLDLSMYKQHTFNQILNIGVPNSAGYYGAVINAGEIQNKGIEISLKANPIKSANGFNWNLVLNYSKNKNKIVKLHPELPYKVLSEARWAGTIIAAKEKGAYGAIMGKKLMRDPSGNVIHNKYGFPEVSDHIEVVGNGVYDWIGGIHNEFSCKNFSLSFLIDAKVGGEIYSMTNSMAHHRGIHENTIEGREGWYSSEAERVASGVDPEDWTPTGGFVGNGVVNMGTAENPEYVSNSKYVDPQKYWESLFNATPEPFIYDASYVKLRNLVLGYKLPKTLVEKLKLTHASVALQAQNIWTIYKSVPNVDPESNYNNGNGQGLEYGSLPQRFYWGMSVNLKF